MTWANESGFQWPSGPLDRLHQVATSAQDQLQYMQSYTGFIKENIFGFGHLCYKYALAHTHVGKSITPQQKF